MNHHDEFIISEISVYDEPKNPLKWQEPFNDLLDEIYYPGFAKQLVEESPEEYSREYFYFMQLYD